jgi:hypothetical protein
MHVAGWILTTASPGFTITKSDTPVISFCCNRRARNVEPPKAELAKRSVNKKVQDLAIDFRSIIAEIA